MLALRSPCSADVTLLADWSRDVQANGPYDETDPTEAAWYLAHWVERPPDPRTRGYRMLELGGRAVGTVTWIRHPLEDWVGLFGVMIATPSDRGRGLGTQAHRLAVAWLFGEHADLHKLEAWTDSEHLAEQRVLEKCGFSREGLLRRRNRLCGAWRDMAVYGLLRDEVAQN